MNNHLTSYLLIDYIHGELPPEDDALVHAHLNECAACRGEYQREVALSDALRTAARAEQSDFPSLVAAQVWQTIRDAKPSPMSRLGALLRPAITVPAAALLVLGTIFFSPLGRQSAHPTIDVGYYFEMHAAQQALSPFSERGAGSQPVETSLNDAGDAGSMDASVPQLADDMNQGLAAVDALNAVR